MTDISNRNFGYLIAYLIPGFVVVTSFSSYAPSVKSWLGLDGDGGPTVGGFLYVTLAAVAAGMLVSAVRWLVIDGLHHHTGVAQPELDFASFAEKQSGFVALAENHYRYAQHYGNLLVALIISGPLVMRFIDTLPSSRGTGIAVFLAVVVLLFLASRDALGKYYSRTASLLAAERVKDEKLRAAQCCPSRASRCS